MINLKKYFIRIVCINFFGLIYLIDTSSFDQGFFSLQSILYSFNIYIYYFFIFFEAISSTLSAYGLDLSFIDLVFKNFSLLNFKYILFIIYKNLNFIYFILFSFGLIFFLERIDYKFSFKNNYSSKKGLVLISFIIIFLLSIFNINLTHIELIKRYKTITNSWSSSDLILKDTIYYNKFYENNFFRNDNWYNVIKYSYLYKNSSPTGNQIIAKTKNKRKFEMFEKIILEKEYNNIYVIINESYPNFRDQKLKNNLLKSITSNHNNLVVRNFKKGWDRKLSTLGSELDFFCGENINYKKFKSEDLKVFLNTNKCWIYSQRNKNLIYIHSNDEKFYNRSRYKNFFNKTYFRNDLKKMNFKICDQYFVGICDYEILDNMKEILYKKNNNFVVFLTLNNHIPTSKFYVTSFIDCKKNFTLNLSEQFCDIYNNQMYFNKSISRLISRMGLDDLVVLFSDTPPLFRNKDNVHFEDIIDVYFFSKE